MKNLYACRQRRITIITLCVVLRLHAHGQALTSADLLLTEGPTYTMQTITDMLPWDTVMGSNAAWNYDWITVDTTDNQRFQWIEPADGQGADNYPEANYAERSISGANNDYIIDAFYTAQADGLYELGSVGPVLSYVFDAPGATYAFPVVVGDTTHGSYCFTSDGFGVQYHFCGNNYMTYDAAGTLTLPYGTFTDVKHVTLWRSSLETTGTEVDSSYSVRQLWFIPGVPHPVLDVSVFIDGSGTWWPGGRLMTASSAMAVPELAAFAAWNVRPNPTAGSLVVSDMPERTERIDLLAADGRLIRVLASERIGVAPAFDLGDLLDGTYLLRVTSAGLPTVRRFVVAR